jgi:hypothetical protein
MAASRIRLEGFLDIFTSLCRDRDPETEKRPFALIVGAGASRSAGIPTASEMIRALHRNQKALRRGNRERGASSGPPIRPHRKQR